MLNSSSYHNSNIDLKVYPWTDIAYRRNTEPINTLHYHSGFEIAQCWSEGGFIMVDDKIYPLCKGHIYIINANLLHYIKPSKGTDYIRNKITFSPSLVWNILEPIHQVCLLEPFLKNPNVSRNHLFVDSETALKIDNLFYKMTREYSEKREGYSAILAACLIEMLTYIYRLYKEESEELQGKITNYYSIIEKVMSLINKQIGGDLSLGNICNQMHISKYYLCHTFKKTTGMTIKQYIIQKQVSEAKKLMQFTSMPIYSIAEEVGFKSTSVFSRVFKSITGYSPTEYKKNVLLKDVHNNEELIISIYSPGS